MREKADETKKQNVRLKEMKMENAKIRAISEEIKMENSNLKAMVEEAKVKLTKADVLKSDFEKLKVRIQSTKISVAFSLW